MRRIGPRASGQSILLAGAVLLLGIGVSGATAAAGQEGTLVIDRSFELKTSDPQRAFEPTASIVDRALYDTLLTYRGSNVSRPVPLVARSYTASRNAKTYVFSLRRDVRFADGTALTSADVVFSFRRLINLKGNPSFLLAGVTVAARDRYTVVLRSKTPNTALPAIVANTSLGIVNSRLVKAHGGTDRPGADKSDKAEKWLNSADSVGAGSGPYVLKQFSTTSQIVMEANPRYWSRRPAFETVVLRNMIAPTQFINIQRGSHEVAIDLSADQADKLKGNRRLRVSQSPSTILFFALANNNPEVSEITSNKQFQQAVRYAIDYQSLVRLAGGGVRQAAGVIPSMFLGSLGQSDRVRRSVPRAKAALAASGLTDPEVTMEYPSDLTLNGVSFATLAQRIQANLAEVGIKANLAGAPTSTWLTKYRDGKMAFGLSLWGPDYPDPSDYLVFLPGQLVGVRAGWNTGASPALEQLGQRARTTTSDTVRAGLYRQMQRQLNRVGPFFPLIQPTQVFAATADLRNAVFNPVYFIDVARVSAA
jgi:peptide/nickel transport system substrate-binding protein